MEKIGLECNTSAEMKAARVANSFGGSRWWTGGVGRQEWAAMYRRARCIKASGGVDTIGLTRPMACLIDRSLANNRPGLLERLALSKADPFSGLIGEA